MEETTLRTKAGEARLVRLPGPGPTLILIHCAGGNQHTFDPILPHLEDVDVLVPALPGRGGTTGAAFERAEEAGRWVLEIAEAAGIGEFIVAGYSYGGAVAIECALASADARNEAAPRVTGLILVSTGARLRVLPAILGMADEAVRQGTPLLFGEVIYQPGTPAAWIQAAEAIAAKTPPEAARADWRACDTFDRLKDIGRIRVPTLVLSGDRDALTPPKYAAFVAKNIPETRVVTIEGGGHALPVEKPEAVGAEIAGFVGEIRARSR